MCWTLRTLRWSYWTPGRPASAASDFLLAVWIHLVEKITQFHFFNNQLYRQVSCTKGLWATLNSQYFFINLFFTWLWLWERCILLWRRSYVATKVRKICKSTTRGGWNQRNMVKIKRHKNIYPMDVKKTKRLTSLRAAVFDVGPANGSPPKSPSRSKPPRSLLWVVALGVPTTHMYETGLQTGPFRTSMLLVLLDLLLYFVLFEADQYEQLYKISLRCLCSLLFLFPFVPTPETEYVKWRSVFGLFKFV